MIRIVENCGQVSAGSNVDQPGVYVMDGTSVWSPRIWRSTYTNDGCTEVGDCCNFFKPGILTCGLVDPCEGY